MHAGDRRRRQTSPGGRNVVDAARLIRAFTHLPVRPARRRSHVMTGPKDAKPGSAAADEVTARAVEGMLGPNPFVGLRGEDILATVKQVAGHAASNPML